MIVRVDTLGVQEAGKSSNDNAHEQSTAASRSASRPTPIVID